MNLAFAVNYGDSIGVSAKSTIASGNIIGYDEIELLLLQLLPGIFHQVAAFSGKAYFDEIPFDAA